MSFPDASVEPRKVFLTYLIQRLAKAEFLLYEARNYSATIDAMEGLIDTLDGKTKKKMQDLRNRLDQQDDSADVTPDNLKVWFSELASLLHASYLQEIQLGVIPTSTLPQKTRAPDKKEYAEKLDAKV